MREKTCCFTGHRKLPTGPERDNLATKLEKTIVTLIQRGIVYYGAGGALGFDTLAAQTILKLQREYPNIKLILVLPCRTQTKGWPAGDVKKYEWFKARANKVIYTSEEYDKDCMYKRNRHLVDYSSICVCYHTKNTGGTYYTVTYAKAMGLEIINLALF